MVRNGTEGNGMYGKEVSMGTDRLLGSWDLRDLAFATGSNDCTSGAGVDRVNVLEDSRSLRSSERDRAGAWSELLRREQKA